MASLLLPIFKLYQIILYPVAKPTAKMLDAWLGPEGIHCFRERDMREVIKKHIEASDVDIDRIEGLGALNFLDFDDLRISQEGEDVDPKSIIQLPFERGFPVFPQFERTPSDPFMQKIQSSGKKWVIITDETYEPHLILDADGFLRTALFDSTLFQPYSFCHRPIIVKNPLTKLGSVIWQLKVRPETAEDDVIDHDVILLWSDEKRMITGADILGRLMRGITTRTRK